MYPFYHGYSVVIQICPHIDVFADRGEILEPWTNKKEKNVRVAVQWRYPTDLWNMFFIMFYMCFMSSDWLNRGGRFPQNYQVSFFETMDDVYCGLFSEWERYFRMTDQLKVLLTVLKQ